MRPPLPGATILHAQERLLVDHHRVVVLDRLAAGLAVLAPPGVGHELPHHRPAVQDLLDVAVLPGPALVLPVPPHRHLVQVPVEEPRDLPLAPPAQRQPEDQWDDLGQHGGSYEGNEAKVQCRSAIATGGEQAPRLFTLRARFSTSPLGGLLVPQRHYRIHPRCPPSGQPAGQQSNDRQEQDIRYERQGIPGAHAVEEGLH